MANHTNKRRKWGWESERERAGREKKRGVRWGSEQPTRTKLRTIEDTGRKGETASEWNEISPREN